LVLCQIDTCVNEANHLGQIHYEYNKIKAVATTMDKDKLLSWAINSGYQ
jgi:nitrate reductase beta subunit